MTGSTMTPLDALAERVRAVVARFPDIAAAWLFGSALRGQLRPDSDVDVAILFREPGTTAVHAYRQILDLASQLEAATAPHVPDVVVLEDQGPIFAHRVLLEGRRVHEADRDRRIDFEWKTSVRALDFRPTWEIAARGQVEGMRRWLRETRS
jgi:predicted nucleotidyltransferase